jgi:hypothetical protein
MKKPNHVQEAATQLVAEHPELPARTLARMLHKADPMLFPTIEQARSAVRIVLGVHGEHNRQQSAKKELHRPPRQAGQWDGIPKGEREINWTAHTIRARRVLMLSDLHVPYHDRESLITALEVGKAENCDHLFINGDLMDCYAISRWETNPAKRSFKKELTATRATLKAFTEA